MSNISPNIVFDQVAKAVPRDCLSNIVVIGSLAAGYHFFSADKNLYVRTKDVDSVLRPRSQAVEFGRAFAEKLLAKGWHHKQEGDWSKPGDEHTPDRSLPVLRLVPPYSFDWFLELLTEPERGDPGDRPWLRLVLSSGHFCLPSFSFLALTTYNPSATPYGLFCAKPEMMALANMLAHPTILPLRMSGLIEGRSLKRSNKDLGRVLALARLSGTEEVETWSDKWIEALSATFPDNWQSLALSAGNGIRALLLSADDLEEAIYICNNGLLAAKPVTIGQFTIDGQRLLQDAIDPLARRVRELLGASLTSSPGEPPRWTGGHKV